MNLVEIQSGVTSEFLPLNFAKPGLAADRSDASDGCK